MQVFGSGACAHIPKERRKLDVNAKKLRFDENSKVYRLLDTNIDKVIISRDVTLLKEYSNLEIDSSTIRKFPEGMGYASRVARKKPLISKSNQKKRKEFAYDYQNKHLNFWDHVLWSDESKFNLFKCDGRVRVWRKSNTEFDVKNVQSTIKHEGGGVPVWECMASSEVGELVFIIMDKTVYLNILKNNLKKSDEKLGRGRDFYFQNENDPKHTVYIFSMNTNKFPLFYKRWLQELMTPHQNSDFVFVSFIFICVKISIFEPNKRHLREALLFCFYLKKSAAEAHRMLILAYGEACMSESSCREWFRRFKDGDFDAEDKECCGRPKLFEDEETKAILDEDVEEPNKTITGERYRL
ncbi:Transposable element Tc1 transposase [Anthophora retusa]